MRRPATELESNGITGSSRIASPHLNRGEIRLQIAVEIRNGKSRTDRRGDR